MSIIKGKTNIVAGFGGTKRPLGEVYFSQSSLASDNPGALPGWTGEYYENGKTLFPDLYNFVKAHSELQVTKAQYDSAITSYGECPKYVVDENTAQTSLRLPKYANYIKMAGTEGITQKGAGLPNITGSATTWSYENNLNPTGAFGQTLQNVSSYNASDNKSGSNLTLDASKSNAIYGASDTVTPAHTTLYPWISAYTSAVPASTAQAAEFTGALSGKANTDLSNVLANIDYVVESQVNSDGSWYRKYKSGWLEQGGKLITGTGNYTFLKPYASLLNVTIQAMTRNTDGASNAGAWLLYPNPTNTGFNIIENFSPTYFNSGYWYAVGQGAN